MIAKLEGQKVLNNKVPPETMGATINNKSISEGTTTLLLTAAYATRGLKCLLLVPNIRPRFCCFC